jgi:hypothetical protein
MRTAIPTDYHQSMRIFIARTRNPADKFGDRTRQGYARMRILKPAGHFFQGDPIVAPLVRQFSETQEHQPPVKREKIVVALLRQLPWTHHITIIGQCKRPDEREFYLRLAVREPWPDVAACHQYPMVAALPRPFQHPQRGFVPQPGVGMRHESLPRVIPRAHHQPQRGCVHPGNDARIRTQPRWGWIPHHRFPGVARPTASQPRALLQFPVGECHSFQTQGGNP